MAVPDVARCPSCGRERRVATSETSEGRTDRRAECECGHLTVGFSTVQEIAGLAHRAAQLDPRALVTTPDEIRLAWEIIEETWRSTFDRAAALPEPALHERANDEWSFVETQRHLLFAADVWLRRDALGDPDGWHRLGMPPDLRTGQPDPDDAVGAWGIDVFATPSLAEITAVRGDHLQLVRELADRLTPEEMQRPTSCNPPWIPATIAVPMSRCFAVVIREEWEHHGFAVRDLAVLGHVR